MPSNVTRGNVEGLISVVAITNSMYGPLIGAGTQEFTISVPGVLATDIAIKMLIPIANYGIAVTDVRVSGNNQITITAVNCQPGSYFLTISTGILILGRPSDGYLLPTVSF
jgi:hypothetical protein